MSVHTPNDSTDQPSRPRPRVTLRTLARMAKEDRPFACLTAYDFTTARWLDRAGVHVLLTGDSAANVVLGFDSTVHMPLDFAVTITAAVRRGAASAMVMADMPFMSYHTTEPEALRNAARFMTEGMADIVKVEADASFAPVVRAMTRAGIPVCAHIGTRPQAAALTGGPKASGRTADTARAIVEDARALEDAGASIMLIEAVPEEVTRAVLDATSVPLIGIGAGPACHGQILVVNDLVGLTDQPPRFAEPVAQMGPTLQEAGEEWVRRVGTRAIGGRGYVMAEAEADRFQAPRPDSSESGSSAAAPSGDPH